MTVLLVEDEIPTRDTLRDVLQDEGYKVAVAGNGQEALDQLSSVGDVCVILLDLMMPVMDGLQLLAAMRSDSRFTSTPVLIITSDPTSAPVGVPTLPKPLDLDTLLAAVTDLCPDGVARGTG